MRKINLKTILLIVILFIAVFFRFYALDRHDVLTDEASISFRAIGYLDFLATPYQTTPLEWMEERPLWTYLSFHDHPPLNFLIQFVFFKVFGISIFIMRLPAALFGVLSVLILYLIGRRLGGELPGLLAAGVLAINDYHIWVSRIALQESAAIFFILLSFLILLKTKPSLYLFGLVSGLALLIKIHAVIIFPIAFIYIWFTKREIFKTKTLYWSLLISLAVFSPYIIYNIFLFKTFGHFDFQFSYLLGQNVPEWSARPGRFEFQTFNERFKFFFVNLKEILSPVMFWVSFISVAGLIVGVFKKTSEQIEKNKIKFILSAIVLYFLFFVLIIGPSRRFLVMIVPWFILGIAYVFYWAFIKYKKIILLTLLIFLVFEGIFSFNTSLSLAKPKAGFFSSRVLKQVSYPYGYNSLDPFIDNLFNNKKSAILLPIRNKNLSKFVENKLKERKGEEKALMVIYDPRFYGEAVLWTLTQRFIYEGWPVITYDIYKEALDNLGDNFFRDFGVKEFYYIAPAEGIILEGDIVVRATAPELENFRQSIDQGLIGEIENLFGDKVFRIYKFN